MESNKPTSPVLSRVLSEIQAAQNTQSATTAHSVYTSGVFEDAPKEEANPVLSRVLGEIQAAQGSQSSTTAHAVYTSGVFEDEAKQS
jgi:hypothetical protein